MRVSGLLVISFLAPALASGGLHFHPVFSLAPSTYLRDAFTTDARTTSWAPRSNTTIQPLISNDTSIYVEQLLEEWDSTGLSLAVVQKDSSVTDPSHPGWRIEFGSYGIASSHRTASCASEKPITPDTLFAIASNSKLFLSISVGLLIHNKTLGEDFKKRTGKELGWKTQMRDLLGDDWTLLDEDIEGGATVADLLGHRTGLPRHDYSGKTRKGNVKEMIQTLRYLRSSATFRETFQYNNLMYETLSYLPELFFSQTYESYIAQHLFEPLNMTSSTFAIADVDEYYIPSHRAKFADRMAQGHLADGRDFTRGRNGTLKAIVPNWTRPGDERTWAGAGGVITTARDLSTWVAMLLSDGVHPYNSSLTVVPKEVLSFVTHGRSIISGVPLYPHVSPMVYGAAQFRYGYRGLDVIEHGGNNPGFKTQVARFPEKKLGVISLSNDGERGGMVLEAAKWAVVDDLVFGETEARVNWSKLYRTQWEAFQKEKREKPTPRPKHPEAPTSPLRELGRKKFRHRTYGDIALCRVPEALLRNPYGLAEPHSTLKGLSLEAEEAQQTPFHSGQESSVQLDWGNLHTNCTHLLSNPSTLHIISSTPYSPSQKPPPTFIATFPHSFSTHLRVVHFTRNLFNVTVVWANDDVRQEVGLFKPTPGGAAEDESAMVINLDETFTLEWVSGADGGDEEGLAITGGFWGMEGPDAAAPVGAGKDGAEVWFASA